MTVMAGEQLSFASRLYLKHFVQFALTETLQESNGQLVGGVPNLCWKCMRCTAALLC